MNKIETKNFGKELEKPLAYNFTIAHQGSYVIEITASTKAWWQNIASRTKYALLYTHN